MWNEEELASVAGISGEDNQSGFYSPPAIRQQGKTGEFTRKVRTKEGSETEVLTPPFDVVFLKHRSQISSAFVPGKVKKASYFTSEFDSPKDFVEVMKLDGGKIDTVATGLTPDKAYDFIFNNTRKEPKREKILYVLLSGAVNKLFLKGGSMAPYFEYLKAIKPKHSFQVVTQVGSSGIVQNEAGVDYVHMTFTMKGESDPAQVKPAMLEVDQKLKSAAPRAATPSVTSAEDASLQAAWAGLTGEAVIDANA